MAHVAFNKFNNKFKEVRRLNIETLTTMAQMMEHDTQGLSKQVIAETVRRALLKFILLGNKSIVVVDDMGGDGGHGSTGAGATGSGGSHGADERGEDDDKEDKEEADNNSEDDSEDLGEEEEEDEMTIYIKKPDGTVTDLLATPIHAGEVCQGAAQEQDGHPQT